MSTIAIITARGGSKRIPKKNIKEFAGRPILAYTIEAALQSGVFDEVMVSTDSEEIARIALEYGASVPFFRSEKTANDYAATADVVAEVLEEYKKLGKSFDVFCCLYPTAPFITGDRLKEAWEKMLQAGAPGILPVTAFSFPPQRCFVVAQDGSLRYKWPEYRTARSQDLEKYYHDAGQFYFVRTQCFLKEKTVVPAGVLPLILDETEVQDIDNETDWILAELKYKLLRSTRENETEA